MVKLLACLSLLFVVHSGFANDTITIAPKWFQVDHHSRLIVCNQPLDSIHAQWGGVKLAVRLDTLYTFAQPQGSLVLGARYAVISTETDSTYSLYFTQLPIVSIRASGTIVDEPRILAQFAMTEHTGAETHSRIGVEYRGAWSQTLPKKSLRIEFWVDDQGDDTRDEALLGMRSDDDWNLQAMYNEPLRFNSKTSNELWRRIYTPYYLADESKAINGIRMEYAELFVDNTYRGVYAVSERVDRKQLQLKKHNGNFRGELYKADDWGTGGAVRFEGLPDTSLTVSDRWDGFEYDYPDEVDPQWRNLYELVDFVVNSDHDAFYTEYPAKFDVNNAVDYFLFLNLIRATDNTGKNMFVARYNAGEPYFFVPWDLDGTFGIVWDGSEVDITNDLLTNGLYHRLWYDCEPGRFRDKLRARWSELRQSFITTDSIMHMFRHNYDYLHSSGVYAREPIAWPDYTADATRLQYIEGWLQRRLEYLDTRFNEDCITATSSPQPAYSVQLFPSPATQVLNVQLPAAGQSAQLSLYNARGQRMLHTQLQERHNKLRLPTQLANGVYFVRIEGTNFHEVQKIIIQR